jgi:predicted Zn-dependent peptidase
MTIFKTFNFKNLFFALFLLSQTGNIRSQEVFSSIQQGTSPGGISYTYIENDPAMARYYTLKNGLTVIISQNKEKPRIQTLMAVKAGSKHDPANHTGLAHYLEHMLFKGTDKYGTVDFNKEQRFLAQIDSLYEVYNQTKDETVRKKVYRAIDSVSLLAAEYAVPNEYDKLMQAVGAERTNAFTSFEQTVYINDVPANQFERWLKIESERYRNPVLRLFHTELEAVYEEKNISMDNDMSRVFEGLLEGLFPNHPYGTQTTIGAVEHLKNPSLKAIREYYQTYYVPNNMALILSGDLEYDETIKLVNQYFGYMEAKPVPAFTQEDAFPRVKPFEKEIVGPSAEGVYMGFKFPGVGTREADLLYMLDLILTNSKAGLIDLNLNKSQKVLGAGSSALMLKDYSVLYFYASPKEGQSLEEVRNLIFEQINHIQTGNFDESLLKGIVYNEIVDEIQGMENYDRVAYQLMDAFTKEEKWMDRLNRNYRLSKIKKEDIMEFARSYFGNDYVVIYKRKGENTNKSSIEKPEISKIPLNRDKTSDFAAKIISEEVEPLTPVFPDFNKDMIKGKLGNADFFHIKNSRNELFTLYYVVDYGKFHDKKLSIALDYLDYLGTTKYSADEISRKFYDLGCNFGVSSDNRYSYVYLTGLNSNFEESLTLFEHLLKNAVPDAEAWSQLKDRIIKGRDNNTANKAAIRRALTQYALYGISNPGTFHLTNKELSDLKPIELTNLTKQLLEFPHHVVYYGPLETAVATQKIKALHTMPKKFKKVPEIKEFTPIEPDKNKVYFTHYDMVQAEIAWIKPGAEFNAADLPLVKVFNDYFGGGMSSVVFQEIRESQALAYSTFAGYMSASRKNEKSQIMAYVGTQSDKLNQAVHSMNFLLNELPENENALLHAKESISSSIATSRTSKTSVYFSWRRMNELGLTKTESELIYEKIPSITMQDVVQFHKKHFANQHWNYVIVSSRENVSKEQLSTMGILVEELTLNELFGY